MSRTNNNNRRAGIIGALLLYLVILNLTACVPGEEVDVQKIILPLAETAAREAGGMAKTEAEKIKDTAFPVFATEIVGKLTPEPVRTAQPPERDDIVTYSVVKGDTLSKIASTYSIKTDNLIELNRDRYPSLRENPNYVEVGWILIISTGSGQPISPPPSPASEKIIIPSTCDENLVYWAEEGFDCQPYRLDAVTEIGLLKFACINDANPLGYSKTHTIYDGWVITKKGNIFSYGWFMDKEKKQVVIGPAIITKTTKYVVCGIPANP
jgi:hypothetical protein